MRKKFSNLTIKPGYVSTKMIDNKKVSLTCPPVDEESKAILKSIGIF